MPFTMVDELEPGTVLRQKYRIDRLLGRGGMGIVVEAWHNDLERRVAIKVLHSELRSNVALVERFLREGRAASKIEGDHVARILDVDRLEDGTPFLVMEYLEGKDLSWVRRTRQPLSIQEAVDYTLQACSAISKAHARGIIHRDVKPANLFLATQEDGSSTIKVLDFGISKMANGLGGSQPSITSTSLIMGSAEYMSPEQMLSTRDVDARTDVWALGVVLYELLTATVPFPGESVTQVCALVMMATPPRPRSVRAGIPESIEQVILRCLEKDRQQRFTSVDALSAALRATLANTSSGTAPVRSPDPSNPTVETSDGAREAAPEIATSVLPTTPVPYHRSENLHGAMVSGPSATGATPLEATPQPQHQTSSPSLRQESRTSQSGPFQTGSLQLGGSLTNAALSSDPIPKPPRRPVAAAVVGGALLFLLLGLGLGTAQFLSSRKPSSSAEARTSATTTGAPPVNTTATASDERRKPIPIISVADAVAEPAASAPATATSATSTPMAVPGRAAGTPKPKRETVNEPTTKPTATAKPVRPSGID